MALFGRGGAASSKTSGAGATLEFHSILGKQAYCRICDKASPFSRCWLRVKPVSKCGCCGTALPDAEALYKRRQPACPACGEWLEQAGFEYGLCDGCGSKYEITEGCRPCLIPNRTQRTDMDKVGRSRSHD